jgi:hypothetical protein
LAVNKRVVDHRREKVDGLDDGDVIGEFVDAGVVVRFGADEQVRVNDPRNVAQNLRNPLGGELACSAGTRRVVDQAFLPAEKQHEVILPTATARLVSKRGQAPLPERPEGCCAQRCLTPF